ncbi:M-phase phosphoprotein 6 [Anoplopoma fimbria]|uniref:M-phase phosphoprotein 6 n=1 Tax=Anoplopoma fimbria TaxID=229290 RepID=UPI0023EDE751|nr:M-phase phosphoprotein 6 [Anoplopoma fimbria]
MGTRTIGTRTIGTRTIRTAECPPSLENRDVVFVFVRLHTKENFILEEKSFVPCEELRFGRISFKGFNPEVEKLMALMNPRDEEEKEEEEISRMQTDVTDEEMALRYESLVRSMKKKFSTKRERAATEEEDMNHNVVETKRVFMKPQD